MPPAPRLCVTMPERRRGDPGAPREKRAANRIKDAAESAFTAFPNSITNYAPVYTENAVIFLKKRTISFAARINRRGGAPVA